MLEKWPPFLDLRIRTPIENMPQKGTSLDVRFGREWRV